MREVTGSSPGEKRMNLIEKEEYIVILVPMILVLSLFFYIGYEIAYEDGYYKAKQEDYCHNYCFDNMEFSSQRYLECNNACMLEDSYTNYWQWKDARSQQDGMEKKE
jgi:hypothetical protein